MILTAQTSTRSMHTCRTMFHFWKRGNSISIAARPTQDSQRSTGSSTASSGWSISASRTSCSADGPWRSSAGCWAQRWPRRCRARLPAPVPATGICYAEGLAKGLGKPMVNALEKLHRPNNRTLCFADVERRTGADSRPFEADRRGSAGQTGHRGGRGHLHGHDAAHRLSDAARGGCGEGAYRDPDADEQLPLRAVCPARDAVAGGQHAAVENAGLFRRGPPHLHSGTVVPGDRKALRRSLHRLLRRLRSKNPYPARHARDTFSMQWSCGYRRNCKNP